jgi:hypothetical protein
MSVATTLRLPIRVLPPETSLEVTLLELVGAVSDECETEAEVVATVLHLLGSGRARLRGSFRSTSLRELLNS